MRSPQQFESLIADSRRRYMESVGAEVWTAEPVTVEEAELLFRGFESKLIVFDNDDGRLRLEAFAPHPNTGTKSYQLFGNYRKSAYWMWREMFIQIGFGIELVLDWNWPAHLVAFETKGFDIVAAPAAPTIMAEAKVKAEDLDEQFRVFSEYGKGGSQTNANRYVDLKTHQPSMYAAVALGTRRYYEIKQLDESLRFNRVPEPIAHSA